MWVVSPCCRATLEPAQSSLLCRRCGREWPQRAAGFLDLLDADPYWGELPREQMRRLLELCRASGEEAAWAELTPELRDPALPRYARSPLRGSFLPQVLPERCERAVDLGAGYGAVARELTRFFAEVVALEAVRERIEYASLVKAPGSGRLVLVRASWAELPLAPGSVDLALMIGVLEWVGLQPDPHDPRRSPRAMQVEALRRVRDLLRPGGRLVVAIENRFGLDLLRGAPDHLGHRYTSLMPRWLADRVVRAAAGDRPQPFAGDAIDPRHGYRVWTYGARGSRSLLRAAGFGRCELLCCWSSYVVPELLGPDRAVARLLSSRRRRLSRPSLVRAAWRAGGRWAVHWLAPSFFLVAE